MTTSDKIVQLEKRLADLQARLKTFETLPESAKVAMEMSTNMLIEEIEDRLAALREGRPDPYE